MLDGIAGVPSEIEVAGCVSTDDGEEDRDGVTEEGEMGIMPQSKETRGIGCDSCASAVTMPC